MHIKFSQASRIAFLLLLSVSCNHSTTTAAEPREDVAPDVAMTQLYQKIADGKAEAAWNYMPVSLQKRIDKNVQTFANRVDPEVWNKTVDLFRKLEKILISKKGIIVNSMPIDRIHPEQEVRIKFVSHIAKIANIIHTSELGSLEKLSKFEGSLFMKNSCSRALKELSIISAMPLKTGRANIGFDEMFKKAKVTTLNREGDKATLRFQFPGKESEDTPFVKVDGKWISQSLKTDVMDSENELIDFIEKMTPENIALTKPRLLQMIQGVDDTLTKMQNANTEKEMSKELIGASFFIKFLLQRR